VNEGDTGGSFLWLSLVSTEADFAVRYSYSPPPWPGGLHDGATQPEEEEPGAPAAAKVSPIFYLDRINGMLDERSGVASHTVHRGRQRGLPNSNGLLFKKKIKNPTPCSLLLAA